MVRLHRSYVGARIGVENMNYTTITVTSDDTYSNLHSRSNSHGDFINHLDHPFTFDGVWEVALSEISYVDSVRNITDETGRIVLDYDIGTYEDADGATRRRSSICELKIKPGFYSQVSDLNKRTSVVIGDTVRNFSTTGAALPLQFQYNNFANTTTLQVPVDTNVFLHAALAEMLGLTSHTREIDDTSNPLSLTHRLIPANESEKNSYVGEQTTDLNRSLDTLRVLSDIARPCHAYGHEMISLLRSIPTGINPGSRVLYEPQRLDWMPMRLTSIDSIHILIYDSNNRIAHFDRGPSRVKLKFRPRRDTAAQL